MAADKTEVTGTDLVAEIDRLDQAGNYPGIKLYLKGLSYADNDGLFCLYRLMTEGRFQAALAVANALQGQRINNPAIDLARSVGGVLFGDADDETEGGQRLTQHAAQIDPDRLKMFRDSVAAPVYLRLVAMKAIGGNSALESRLLSVLKSVIPELGGPAGSTGAPAASGATRPKRNFNFVLFNHPMISWYQLDDIIRPMMAGLSGLGNRVAVNGPWNTSFVQVFIEQFVHESIFTALKSAKKVNATLGLLLTEDSEELRTQEQHKGRWEILQQSIPYFDFFWDYTNPSVWHNYVPKGRIAHVGVGSYPDSRPLITSQRDFDPTLDFIIYGRQTPYRDEWHKTLTGLNYTVEYTYLDLPNSQSLPPPDYVSQSMLGSAAVLLDIPRAEFVRLPSPSRLAFALQNGLPVIADDRIILEGTVFQGYVERASLADLVVKRRYYLSREFRRAAEARAAEWRAKYKMSDVMAPALAVVPPPR